MRGDGGTEKWSDGEIEGRRDTATRGRREREALGSAGRDEPVRVPGEVRGNQAAVNRRGRLLFGKVARGVVNADAESYPNHDQHSRKQKPNGELPNRLKAAAKRRCRRMVLSRRFVRVLFHPSMIA